MNKKIAPRDINNDKKCLSNQRIWLSAGQNFKGEDNGPLFLNNRLLFILIFLLFLL